MARTTLGQMVIRIALQCNEADAYLIMDDNNPAPRLLSRPGEGIYNDMAGMLEGNSPFQVVWLPDQVQRQLSGESPGAGRPRKPEGRSPKSEVRMPMADRCIRARLSLRATRRPTCGRTRCCSACWRRKSVKPRRRRAGIWLGAPNSIKGPTEAVVPAAKREQPADRRPARGDLARHHVDRPHLAGRAVPDGRRALHPVRRHAARHAAARVPRPRPASHPAPDHAWPSRATWAKS